MLGIFKFKEVIYIAKQKKLKVVAIYHFAEFPVYKIVDLKKYQYQIKRKFKYDKKKHKMVITKEIKIRINIASSDFNIKLNNAKKFLVEGKRVKISLLLRGRETEHKKLGFDIIRQFQKCLERFSDLYISVFREGKVLISTILPKKNNL